MQHFLFNFKVIGDHQKKRNGENVYEVGVYLYTRGTQNKSAYKKGEEWGLMESSDIIRTLDQPTPKKVTNKCIVYHFKNIDV